MVNLTIVPVQDDQIEQYPGKLNYEKQLAEPALNCAQIEKLVPDTDVSGPRKVYIDTTNIVLSRYMRTFYRQPNMFRRGALAVRIDQLEAIEILEPGGWLVMANVPSSFLTDHTVLFRLSPVVLVL